MGVKFLTWAQGAGSDGSFTDTFIRTASPEGAGVNWAVNRQQSAVDIQTYRTTGTQLEWIRNAGGAPCHNFMWPLPGGALFGSGSAGTAATPNRQAPSHFSEITIAADNSVGGSLTRQGPAVAMGGLIAGADGNCYTMDNLPELLTFNLERWNNSALTTIVDHSATPLYATVVGLVLKLSVEFTSSTVTTIRTYINGTLIDTFLDSSGSRLTNGMPGMYGQFASLGRSCQMSKYRCGPGI